MKQIYRSLGLVVMAAPLTLVGLIQAKSNRKPRSPDLAGLDH